MDRSELALKEMDLIVESLGYEEAFMSLVKALSTDEQIENFEWIIRMHDLGDVEDYE